MCMDGDFTLATAKTMNESKGQDVHEQANFGTVRQDIGDARSTSSRTTRVNLGNRCDPRFLRMTSE